MRLPWPQAFHDLTFGRSLGKTCAVKAFDPIKPWFISAQETGEFVGIRFGHIPEKGSDPEWHFMPHTDVDGIGGFAELLRARGATISRLPQIKHPSNPSRLALLQTVPKFLSPRNKLEWLPIPGHRRPSTSSEPPVAVAWHVFNEGVTTNIRRVCRRSCITVNSFLVKHLTKAIRPFLADQSSTVPWMIPVNLRGKVSRSSEIENHSSYVSVMVQSFDTVHDVHRNIYAALARGEHWANWYAYESSRLLSGGMRRFLIRKEKYMAQWHIGAFSNLGDWDPEKELTQAGCSGNWLFCPPVLRCQHLGTGCVTFQNRLSLLIQVHPELTTDSAAPQAWMQSWVKEIETDLASVLDEPEPSKRA